jgi:hypothetical protein
MGFWDGATRGLDKGTAMGFRAMEMEESKRRHEDAMGMQREHLSLSKNQDARQQETHDLNKQQAEKERDFADSMFGYYARGKDPNALIPLGQKYAPEIFNGTDYKAVPAENGGYVLQFVGPDGQPGAMPFSQDDLTKGIFSMLDPKGHARVQAELQNKLEGVRAQHKEGFIEKPGETRAATNAMTIAAEGRGENRAIAAENRAHNRAMTTPKPQHYDLGGQVVTGAVDPKTGAFTQAGAMSKTLAPGDAAKVGTARTEAQGKHMEGMRKALSDSLMPFVEKGESVFHQNEDGTFEISASGNNALNKAHEVLNDYKATGKGDTVQIRAASQAVDMYQGLLGQGQSTYMPKDPAVDAMGQQYKQLVKQFGPERARAIMRQQIEGRPSPTARTGR